MKFHDLPALNACLNAASAVLLLLGRWFIGKGDWRRHRACMLTAVVTSSLFLVGYLTYHSQAGTTRFTHPGWPRVVYLSILSTHTVLAGVIVPMVAITLSRALRERFDRHKAIARWTFPLWLYVSVTGVLIYLMLYRIWPPGG